MCLSEIQEEVFLRISIVKNSCISNTMQANYQNKSFLNIFSIECLEFLRNEFHKVENGNCCTECQTSGLDSKEW